MKRVVLILLALVVLAGLGFVGYNMYMAQRADFGWNPSVAEPMFTDAHPIVLFDEGHNNASTVSWTGRYWPFARLVRQDGYKLEIGEQAFSAVSLDSVDILVTVNASGASKPQFLGINLPNNTDKKREDPAFTPDEIRVVRDWVSDGGSLLLIADHAPFGAAASALAEAFNITMHQGFVEIPDEISDPLVFSEDNHRLGQHPIITGNTAAAAIHRVMTFTGQSLDAPPEAVPLLLLPQSSAEYRFREGGYDSTQAGSAQGFALEYGKGRLVVLGEAAMLTAQVARREPFGMNAPPNDNQQFALNIMHWLSHKL